MPKRKITFQENEYYHIYNRGVDKRVIFQDRSDYLYFFKRLIDLNQKRSSSRITTMRSRNKHEILSDTQEQLVDIVAYNLLPNHFHLILREKTENGIARFMQKIGTSYTRYFNIKHDRTGVLFQGRFKAKAIDGTLSLPVLSAYVNLNHQHHHLTNPSKIYSSMFEYLDTPSKKTKICDSYSIQLIRDEIKTDYQTFAQEQSAVFKKNKEFAKSLENKG